MIAEIPNELEDDDVITGESSENFQKNFFSKNLLKVRKNHKVSGVQHLPFENYEQKRGRGSDDPPQPR